VACPHVAPAAVNAWGAHGAATQTLVILMVLGSMPRLAATSSGWLRLRISFELLFSRGGCLVINGCVVSGCCQLRSRSTNQVHRSALPGPSFPGPAQLTCVVGAMMACSYCRAAFVLLRMKRASAFVCCNRISPTSEGHFSARAIVPPL
jgi:hypothetical protein